MHSQTVLITGGAKRIGRAIALRLAHAGYNLAIHYNHSSADALALQEEIRSLGRVCSIFSADFSTEFSAKALMQECEKKMGAISHLINNASLYERDTLDDFTQTDFDSHMHVNVLAPLKLIHAFADHCQAHQHEGCSIINCSDGTKGGSMSSKFLTYALSKSALNQLSSLLAPELAPNVRINTLALGPSLVGDMDNEEVFNRLADRAPLKRVSNADEVCDAVEFLLNALSITGQTIALNNGMHFSASA